MDWEEARQLTDKILQLKARLDNPQENENLDVIAAEYHDLRQKLLTDWEDHASDWYWGDIKSYIDAGVFTREELVKKGLLRPRGRMDSAQLPDLYQYMAYPNYEAKEGCTDVYFFGIDGSGRACLLMGLTGAEGMGYSINYMFKGGPYASVLKQYLDANAFPWATPNSFVTTFNCIIDEPRMDTGSHNCLVLSHFVNFVRMGGGELEAIVGGYRFVGLHGEKQAVASSNLMDLGYGARLLLGNTNRKIFFIIVDPERDGYGFSYNEGEYDAVGNCIGMHRVRTYIDQEAVINQFVDLITMDNNKELMKKVDAIHFIVTKADTLGKTQEERNRKAHALLINKHRGSVYKLMGYCRRTKRIDQTTDFQPRIFTFSLGKFYLDGYEYDSKDSLYLIDALRHMTQGTKESSGLRKLFGQASEIVQPRPGDFGIKINMDE